MLALEQIVKNTDDQLERLGAPRLMAGIPTTAEERRQSVRKERMPIRRPSTTATPEGPDSAACTCALPGCRL